MARIKFLDVLEETKSSTNRFEQENPSSSKERTYKSTDRDFGGFQSRFSARERVFDHSEMSNQSIPNNQQIPIRESRRSEEFIPDVRESRFAFDKGNVASHRIPDSHVKSAHMKPSSAFDMEDNKTLWTGALFVFFGGLLFLSGYWFGKNVTDRVKQENISLLNESSEEFKREELNTLNAIAELPTVTPAVPKVLKVVEPALPELPKKSPAKVVKKQVSQPVAPSKEYVIQVSTHSSMDAARQIEDSLRASGFSAYISENIVGNVAYFRVRIRGFDNRSTAEKTLTDVKSTGFGSEGYVLTLD
ncbi:MAG: SPOR domain-containing protein [Brevinema sp.]